MSRNDYLGALVAEGSNPLMEMVGAETNVYI